MQACLGCLESTADKAESGNQRENEEEPLCATIQCIKQSNLNSRLGRDIAKIYVRSSFDCLDILEKVQCMLEMFMNISAFA